jgi:hypothetical protein
VTNYTPDHSSVALKHLHAVLTVAWVLVIAPVLLIPGAKESVALLVFISIYANIAGHASAWQASRTEEKQDEQDES